jgi:glycosyltransferase involved in cell wall biosynthesis
VRIALVLPGGLSPEGRGNFIPVLAWLTERIAAKNDVTAFVLAQDEQPSEYFFRGARVVSLGAPLDLSSNRRDLGKKVLQLRKAVERSGRFDIAHAFWANTCGFLSALALPPETPLMVSLAGGEFACLPGIGYGQETTVAGRLRVSWALRRADVITAASGFIEVQAARRGYRTERVPLGVGPECFLPIREVRSRPPFSILSVASLNRVKAPFVLLEAFRRLLDGGIDAHLTMAGEDTLMGAVQTQAGILGMSEQISFPGHLPPSGVRAMLQSADLLVVSSLHEAGPIAALEAAASGVPICGTSVGHLADWAPDLCTTVQPGSPSALAQALRDVLMAPALRERARNGALGWAREFDADWTAKRFLALYERLRKVGGRA